MSAEREAYEKWFAAYSGTCDTWAGWMARAALAQPTAPESPPQAQKTAPAAQVAITWVLNGDKTCGYNNWLGVTPFGRILITWKGWKERLDASVDEFPGDFQCYGLPDEVKAKCEQEFARRIASLADGDEWAEPLYTHPKEPT